MLVHGLISLTTSVDMHVEEVYAFHDPCISGGDAPLSLYVAYIQGVSKKGHSF